MTLYPNSGALFIAGVARTALAASKMHLYQGTSLVPSPSTTLAELDAIEADFSGYPAGGAEITNFLPPLLNPLGGAGIESGLLQFQFTAPVAPAEPVANVIGGWYLVDATGKLVSVGTFPSGIAVGEAGQGVPFNVQLLFGTITG